MDFREEGQFAQSLSLKATKAWDTGPPNDIPYEEVPERYARQRIAVSTCKSVGAEKAWVSKDTAKEMSGRVEIAIKIKPPTRALYDPVSTCVAVSKDL